VKSGRVRGKMTGPHLTPWPSVEVASEAAIREALSREGLHPYSWSNGPGDVYAPHSHDYDKVVYVVSGSISFGLPLEAREVKLATGDRLDLPAGTLHNARVGADGVVCLEAHK
jgi:uncharacterized protein YjlB